jgi:chloramphenicol-sensitive protein RarD
VNKAAGDTAVARSGVLFGLGAYVIWGVFPVYFKLIDSVSPLEILLHRIVWAVPFGALILSLRRQWPDVVAALRCPRTIAWLVLSALCISGNWLIYIWGVVNARIFEASLGYYINPLMYVVVGVLFFGERLRPAQWAAVALATVGVLVLTLQGGVFPWVSLSLAFLFTAYGVIRKQVSIAAMPGLFAETTLLFPFAAIGLGWLIGTQAAAVTTSDTPTAVLLLLAGPVTVFPLLFFAIAARALTLTTVGFMQFIAPTLQFFIAVYYGESLTPARLICFACIWSAVAIFSIDAVLAGRRRQRVLAEV